MINKNIINYTIIIYLIIFNLNVYSDIGLIDLNKLSIISDKDISRLLLEYESESIDKESKIVILQKLMMSPQNKKYLNKLNHISINNDNSYWEAM